MKSDIEKCLFFNKMGNYKTYINRAKQRGSVLSFKINLFIQSLFI